MSRKTFIAVLIPIIIVGIVVFGLNNKTSQDLINPLFGQPKLTSSETPSPVPTPNAPKTFLFDSSTDLKMELEKVNPQILDSDFE